MILELSSPTLVERSFEPSGDKWRNQMTIHLSEDVAEAALRAASRAGYTELVQDLLRAGVKASALCGSALTLADYYGHPDVVALLQEAIAKEEPLAR
jgi:hypothetical protein